jgi:hypothetical protein
MPVLLITYDLKKPGQDYSDLYKVIKEYAWARLSESSYAIETNESPEVVFNKLEPYIDANDYLLVITLKRPFAGRNAKDVIDWLESRLTY